MKIKNDGSISGIRLQISADYATGKDYTVITKWGIGDKFNIKQQTYEIIGVNSNREYLLEGLEYKNKLTLRESEFGTGFTRFNDKYIQGYSIVERCDDKPKT